jgi:predicted ArsR family transcriptional regulator
MPDPLQRNDEPPPLWKLAPHPEKSTMTLAGETAAATTAKRYQQITDLLRARGPMTLFEICSQLGKQKNQLSGRMTELKRDRIIEPTGDRRHDPATGCSAEVYRLAKV